MWRLLCALVVTSAPSAITAQAPSVADTIRGTVRTQSGERSAGARVFVTDVESRRTQTVITDSLARFAVRFEGGAGTYVVVVNAPPHAVWRKRVLRGTSSTIDVDVTLASPPVLQTVRVQATRRNPVRRGEATPDVGGAASSVRVDQLPDPQGNVVLDATSVPGVQVIDARNFSVLGMGPEQNRVTLNGMTLGFVELPRDASASARVVTSSSDAGRGGYGGAELAITGHQAQPWTRRILRATAEHPSLSGADAFSRWSGGAERDVQVNGTIDGPLGARFQQATSLQVGERRSDPVSLLQIGSAPAGVTTIPGDLARAFTDGATALGLPVAAEDDARVTRSASLLSRLDAPRTTGMSYDLTLAASANEARGLRLGAQALPTVGGSTRQLGSTVQFGGSQTLWGIARHEPRLGFNLGRAESKVVSPLPRAVVRLDGDELDDAVHGVALLAGGAGVSPSESRSIGWQGRDQLSWFTADNRHRFTAVVDGEWQRIRVAATAPSSGIFTFSSRGDFGANRPSSYLRTLGSVAREGSVSAGALSFGDLWRPSARTQLQVGARADLSTLRLAAGGSATAVDVSPRVGFTQMIGRRGPNGVQGARATVRASVGRYVNRWSGASLAPMLLRAGTRQLECIGDDAPSPQWSAWSAGSPMALDACRGVTTPTSSATDELRVGDELRPDASWRGTVEWSMPLGPFMAVTEAAWSRSERLSYLYDANLRAAPSFRLAAEADRPVFVEPGDVDPGSGLLAHGAARTSGSAAWRVSSGLEGSSQQLAVSLAPVRPAGATRWSLAYVLGSARRQYAGVDAPTGGDSRSPYSAASEFDVRHRVVASARTRVANAVDVMLFANVRSGMPFTPLVSSDINGDGSANDAAFVFDAGADERAVGAAVARVAGTDAGRCLRVQQGRIADANSCRGPWSTTLDANVSTLMGLPGIPRRMSLSVGAINLAAGADALLHGSRTHGWGQSLIPDPFLLHVVGFDPARSAFRYAVNPRFGTGAVARTQRPFRLVLTARMEVGPDPLSQQMKSVLQPGRTGTGARRTAEQIRQMYAQNAPDQIGPVIALRDSVMLSAAQEAALTEIRAWRTSRLEPIWAGLADYLAELPVDYDLHDATRRVQRAQYDAYGVMIETARRVGDVLGPDQFRMLPGSARVYLDASGLAYLRRAYRP